MRISGYVLFMAFFMIFFTIKAQDCITINGNPSSGFTQLFLGNTNTQGPDATQIEMGVAAWTCYGTPCNFRSILKFDLSQIPSSTTITSAKLFLFAKTQGALNGNPGNPTFGSNNASIMQKIVSEWSLNTVGWNNLPLTTTTGQKTLPQSSSTTQNYIVDLTDFVQGWVNDPSSNHGVYFRLITESYYNSMIFYSGSAPEALQPKLEICYEANPAPPQGNFGIGTTNPTAQLHTTGSVRFQGLTTNNSFSKFVTSDPNGNLFLRDVSSIPANNAWLLSGNSGINPLTQFLGTTDNNRFALRTNNVERIAISQNGTIGVGISTGRSLLHVYNTTADNHLFLSGTGPSIRLFPGADWNSSPTHAGRIGLATTAADFVTTSSPGDMVVQAVGSQGNLLFGTGQVPFNGYERMRITNNGLVGIATTNPTARFHINCVSSTNPSNIRFENLQSGAGNVLIIDANGYVMRSSVVVNGPEAQSEELTKLKEQVNQQQTEIEQLKKDIAELKALINR